MRLTRVEKGLRYGMPLAKGGWSDVTAEEPGILVVLTAVEAGAGGVFIPDYKLAEVLPQPVTTKKKRRQK